MTTFCFKNITKYFKEWINNANENYPKNVYKKRITEKYQEEERIKKQIEEQEKINKVMKKIKI